MKTKEEIQEIINFIKDYPELFDDRLYYEKCIILEKLEKQLQQAKSIEDIEKEAFEAGKNKINNPNFDLGLDEVNEMFIYKYNTFEDYLKSIKNE